MSPAQRISTRTAYWEGARSDATSYDHFSVASQAAFETALHVCKTLKDQLSERRRASMMALHVSAHIAYRIIT